MIGAVVASCALAASVIVMRARMRSSAELRLQQEDDLRTWVGEGGKPAPVGVTAHPAHSL